MSPVQMSSKWPVSIIGPMSPTEEKQQRKWGGGWVSGVPVQEEAPPVLEGRVRQQVKGPFTGCCPRCSDFKKLQPCGPKTSDGLER